MSTLLEPGYTVFTPEMSVFITILMILATVVAITYLYVTLNIDYIKNDWDRQRCKYGIVIGDTNNLVHCDQGVLKDVVDTTTKPLYQSTTLVSKFYNLLKSQVEGVGQMLVYIKSQFANIIGRLVNMVYNLFIPIQVILTTFFTMFSKLKAILVAQLYFLISSLLTMKSFMAAIINAIIVVLVALAALIIALMIIPFGWGVALSFLAIFVSISIPLGTFAAAMSKVVNLNIHKIPSKPHVCFDKYTLVAMKNNPPCPIYKLKIGDVLQDGSIITSTLELSRQTAKMYYLNNVLVTGTHLVKYKTTWITVENHPDSVYIPTYIEDTVYCVNTNTGLVSIGSTLFTDWNEMLPDDFDFLSPNDIIQLLHGTVQVKQCRLGYELDDHRIITGIAITTHPERKGIWYHLYYDC
jgi:hypothetical protein